MDKKRNSFTLIELVMSAVILGIGIAILGIMVVNFNKLQQRASYYYVGFNIARDPIEYIESVRWIHDSGAYVMRFSNGQYTGVFPFSHIVTKVNSDYIQHQGDGKYALLPRNAPDSLYGRWDMEMAGVGRHYGRDGQSYGIPLSCYSKDGEFLVELPGFTIANSFLTWIGPDEQRKGLVLGVVPFTWYNQYHLNLENFEWKTN